MSRVTQWWVPGKRNACMAREDDDENVTKLDGNDEAPMTDKADATGCLTVGAAAAAEAAAAAVDEDAAADATSADWLNKL